MDNCERYAQAILVNFCCTLFFTQFTGTINRHVYNQY